MNNKYLGVLVVLFLCINNICSAEEISIKDIISKINSLNSIYYESTTTTSSSMPLPGGDALENGKTWYKKGYLRKDIYSESANAKKIIKVFTPTETYIYNSFEDKTQKVGKPMPFIVDLLTDLNLSDLEKDVVI